LAAPKIINKLTHSTTPGSELRAQAVRTPQGAFWNFYLSFRSSSQLGSQQHFEFGACMHTGRHGEHAADKRARSYYQKRLWLVVCVINCWAAQRAQSNLSKYIYTLGAKEASEMPAANIARGKINWEFTRL